MAVSYKKKKTRIKHYHLYKIINNIAVSTRIMRAIRDVLDLSSDDILEFIPVSEGR